LINKPTDDDFLQGHRLMLVGALVILLSLGATVAIFYVKGPALSTTWQNIQTACMCGMSLGLAIVLWGLRVYATQAEYNSAVRHKGLTPAYEAACTMLSVLFVVAPIVVGLVTFDIVDLPMPPSSRQK
jgi:hypothetical protein